MISCLERSLFLKTCCPWCAPCNKSSNAHTTDLPRCSANVSACIGNVGGNNGNVSRKNIDVTSCIGLVVWLFQKIPRLEVECQRNQSLHPSLSLVLPN